MRWFARFFLYACSAFRPLVRAACFIRLVSLPARKQSKSREESDPKTPPPFAPPPLEDRSKYEKLLSVDCSDADEDAADKRTKPGEDEQPKLGDSDSIGSATDLKNYGSEDDATLEK